MATITALHRLGTQRILTYPSGHTHASCGCDGCKGLKGNCVQATASDQLLVAFRLSDGRAGNVTVALGSGDQTIQAAIAAWAKANPVAAEPLVGATIP